MQAAMVRVWWAWRSELRSATAWEVGGCYEWVFELFVDVDVNPMIFVK